MGALENRRIKSKYILEARYLTAPLIQAFDRRGKILEDIHSHFKEKMVHWRAQNVQVSMADDFESPRKLVEIGHLRSSITYEDPSSRTEFLEDAKRLLKLMCDVFPEGFRHLNRLGFRSLSILRCETAETVDDVFKSFREVYLSADLPVTFPFSDGCAVVMGDSTRLQIGPASKDEDWVKSAFKTVEGLDPPFGLGLDVDCFAKDLEVRNKSDFLKAFSVLEDLAASIEVEAVKGLAK